MRAVSFRYTFEVDGRSYSGKCLIREREMAPLLAYFPAAPKRSVAWGFIFSSGEQYLPGQRATAKR